MTGICEDGQRIVLLLQWVCIIRDKVDRHICNNFHSVGLFDGILCFLCVQTRMDVFGTFERRSKPNFTA
jgi:hypothetical protein